MTDQTQFNATQINPTNSGRSALQIVGGLLVALAGLLSIADAIFLTRYLSDIGQWHWTGYPVVAIGILGPLPVVVLGLLGSFRDKKFAVIAGIGWFGLRFVLVAILGLIFNISYGYNWWNLWITLTGGSQIPAVLSLASTVFALAGAIMAVGAKPRTNAAPSTAQSFDSHQPRFDAMTGQPLAPAANYGLATSASAPGIAIAAFVVSLFFPLIGLILGYVAKSQARTWTNPTAGKGFITAAIVIGWVFTILGVVGGIIWGIVFAITMNSYY